MSVVGARLRCQAPECGRLPGFRVLDGRYAVEQISIAIPKGRDLGLSFARRFVEEAKAEGLVVPAVERAGLRGTVKASK